MTKRFGFLTVQKVALREHWPVLGREALHRFLSSENEALRSERTFRPEILAVASSNRAGIKTTEALSSGMSSPPVFIKGMALPARRFANFGLLKMKRFPIKRPEALRSERPFGRALVIIEALPFATGPIYFGRPKRFLVDEKKRAGARLQSQRSASVRKVVQGGSASRDSG